MDNWDIAVAGYAARLHADRISQQTQVALQEQTREQAYHQYVAAYMTQGFSIEQAHALVQDFFAEQDRMHAQITAAHTKPRRIPRSLRETLRDRSGPDWWFLVGSVVVAVLIVGIALLTGT